MQIVIAGVILSYPHLWELHNYPDEPAEKADYKADFIFPPNFNYGLFEQAIDAAIAEQFPQHIGDPNFKATLRLPYKQQKPDSVYSGAFYISTKCRGVKPTIVDQNLQPIMDRNLLCSGSRVNAQINVFAYPPKKGGSAGVSTTLNMIQLDQTADGVSLPYLGGAVQRPEDHFKPIPGGAPQQAPQGPPAGYAPQPAPQGPPAGYAPQPAPQGPPAGYAPQPAPQAPQQAPGMMPPGVAPSPAMPAGYPQPGPIAPGPQPAPVVDPATAFSAGPPRGYGPQ